MKSNHTMKPVKLATKDTPAPAGMHRVHIRGYYMAYPGAKKTKAAPNKKKKAPSKPRAKRGPRWANVGLD